MTALLPNWLRVNAMDGYVVKMTLASFLIVLVSLTGVIWITQALRNIDLMTSQGQTILVFLGISGLAIPLLISIIAPIALLVAVMHTLNRLSTDSEVIVLSAAGVAPLRFLRPFLISTLVVSTLIATISLWIAPESLRALRRWNTQLGADVVANVIQAGQFINLGDLTLRIQERKPGGILSGIFIDDRRDPAQRVDLVADHGSVQKNERGSFLVLEDGHLERFEKDRREPVLVAFTSYAFDLSQLTNSNPNITYNVHERLMPELLWPDASITNPRELAESWSEVHDRMFAALYPIAFAMLAFAFLGLPRTTRQSRNFAITIMVLGVLVVRIAGFALSTMSVNFPFAIWLQYLLLAVVSLVSLAMVLRGLIVDPPAGLTEAINNLAKRLTPRRVEA